MSATDRNYMWVRDHAYDIAFHKSGIARGFFTVGEVVEVLGFSRNTVKKYVARMIDEGVATDAVISKSLTAYRFTNEYRNARRGAN